MLRSARLAVIDTVVFVSDHSRQLNDEVRIERVFTNAIEIVS